MTIQLADVIFVRVYILSNHSSDHQAHSFQLKEHLCYRISNSPMSMLASNLTSGKGVWEHTLSGSCTTIYGTTAVDSGSVWLFYNYSSNRIAVFIRGYF